MGYNKEKLGLFAGYSCILKVLIFCCTIIFSLSVHAANPLGFKIGKATFDDIQSELSEVVTLNLVGINRYSGGKMLVADNPELLGYSGLDKVTMIFDNKNILTAVVMRLARDQKGKRDAGFMYVYKRLSEKYLPVYRDLKPMGSMKASFVTPDQKTKINMISARASNMFDLQYISNNFWKRYEMAKKEQKNKLQEPIQYSGLRMVSNTF